MLSLNKMHALYKHGCLVEFDQKAASDATVIIPPDSCARMMGACEKNYGID
jgi:hypothetical protein